MKSFLSILLFLLLIMTPALQANTYLWFWVNGEKSTQVTQGDLFAWEYDVSAPGNSATVEIWLDLDGSRDITEGDVLLESFQQRDGEVGNDGPADSSATPDGIVYIMLGQFAFAPQNYLLKVTDQDESTSLNYFEIAGMSNPPATASGTITVEGVTAPDNKLKNVMIGGMGENGICSGLTDINGNYTINLTVAGADWEIGPIFDLTMAGYVREPEGYRQSLPAGNTGSLDFHFSLPSSKVYGDLRDQDGNLVELSGWIGLYNMTTNMDFSGSIENGHFEIPAMVVIMGNDSTNDFSINIDSDLLNPDYMAPNNQESFPVSWGDSVQHDVTVFSTDALIYAYVTENKSAPSQQYRVSAWSDTAGFSSTYSNTETGYVEISVRSGYHYYVSIQEDQDWGTPPPEGMVLEANNLMANAGDTVYFNYVPAQAAIGGTVSFDEGDPTDFDYEDNSVHAWHHQNQASFQSKLRQDNTFEISVLNGTYNVWFDVHGGNNFLVTPTEYHGITVEGNTVDSLHFTLNYAHADLVVKLVGAPVEMMENGYAINTMGEWPNVYQTWRNMQSDSTFHFKVCEGEWFLNLPVWADGELYDISMTDTTVTVTEDDSSYYVEFVYTLKTTGIQAESAVPAQFYLSQNYPNPFNPSTTIAYGLPEAGNVKITIYNILGEKMEVLRDAWQGAGNYTIKWAPQNLSSGVYLYQIETANHVETRKMVFMK